MSQSVGPPITCPAACYIGVDPAMLVPLTGSLAVWVPIPFDPSLVGTTWCIQVFDPPSIFGCVQNVSPALRFTITP